MGFSVYLSPKPSQVGEPDSPKPNGKHVSLSTNSNPTSRKRADHLSELANNLFLDVSKKDDHVTPMSILRCSSSSLNSSWPSLSGWPCLCLCLLVGQIKSVCLCLCHCVCHCHCLCLLTFPHHFTHRGSARQGGSSIQLCYLRLSIKGRPSSCLSWLPPLHISPIVDPRGCERPSRGLDQ